MSMTEGSDCHGGLYIQCEHVKAPKYGNDFWLMHLYHIVHTAPSKFIRAFRNWFGLAFHNGFASVLIGFDGALSVFIVFISPFRRWGVAVLLPALLIVHL
jgi:hypothetical protein